MKRRDNWMVRGGWMLLVMVGVWLLGNSQNKEGMKRNEVVVTGDEAAVRALEERFVAAFNAGDIDAIMQNYVSDKSLVVFDVVPRKQYYGADVYREDWVDFFSHFKGRPRIAIADLGVTVNGDVGFGHSLQHITGMDKGGHPVDRWVRVTDGYRKIGGRWVIALEHVSVPVDLATGKMGVVEQP